MIDALFAPAWIDLTGLWVGLVISLLVFSALLGDHWAARLGQHLLVGAGLGYAGVVVWHALRQSLLVEQLRSDARGYWWHWIGVLLLVLLVAGAIARICWPQHPGQPEPTIVRWLRRGGWAPAAFVAAAALAVGALGTMQGTIGPQLAQAARSGLEFDAPPAVFLNGLLMLALTTGALLYFAVDPVRHLADQPVIVRQIMRGWLWLGQRAVWLAAGVIFARLFASRVSLLIAQFEFWAATFAATGIGRIFAAWWQSLSG